MSRLVVANEMEVRPDVRGADHPSRQRGHPVLAGRRSRPSVAAKQTILLVLLLGAAFSGCIGKDAAPTIAGEFHAEAAQVTASTGSVTGQILTVELEILPGIQVGLVNRTGALVLTQTDTLGNYTFNGVAAGQYRVQVSDPCCKVATQQIKVEPAKVTVVNLQVQRLTAADLDAPFVDEGEWDGFIGCAVSVFSLSLPHCGATDSNQQTSKRFNITEDLWVLAFAMVWPPAGQSVNDELRLELRNRGCSGCSYDYATVIGPSPITGRVTDAEVGRSTARFQLVNGTMDMEFVIGAGSNNLVYQQSFKVVWYEFYRQLPPKDFNPVPDS